MTSYRMKKLLIIDARDHIMGRLASTIAKHLLMGTRVIVLRCERIVMSGHIVRNKLKMMSFLGHTMNTNPRRGPFGETVPSSLFFRVVRGMLPHKKAKGRRLLRLLSCYNGVPPRFAHVPKLKLVTAFRALRLDPNRPYTSMGRLCTIFGWPHAKLMVKLEDKRRIKLAQVHRISKEIHHFRNRATKIVAKRYCEGSRKADYEWMTQFEFIYPTAEEVLAPIAKPINRFKKIHPTKRPGWVHIPDHNAETGEYTKQDDH